MSVVSFASLKGGVGKTSLAVNVAHALAVRGCAVLLVDLDPTSHTTRFFKRSKRNPLEDAKAGLAQLFFSLLDQSSPRGIPGLPSRKNGNSPTSQVSQSVSAKVLELRPTSSDGQLRNGRQPGLVGSASSSGLSFVHEVRPQLSLLPGGDELRHFLWGKGATSFNAYFRQLLDELEEVFDYIVIDTAPDFQVLTRTAIACSDLVLVPLDSSAMSIDCLEMIVESSAHIKGPMWAIARTMVDKRATRVRRLSQDHLQATVASVDHVSDKSVRHVEKEQDCESPIYLLNSSVHRTEKQNALSFAGQTAFDTKESLILAQEYLAVASEVDDLLSMREDAEEDFEMNDLFQMSHSV